ncbi:CBS domain-containing protein, partial [Acinetobacter baumannii]|nr:CBS domain-containing protein [Acinetobacter baumannii]
EETILETIKSSGCSRIPVYNEDDDIVGVLYSKDYLMADENRKYDIKPYVRNGYFVSENMKASELFKRMQLEK